MHTNTTPPVDGRSTTHRSGFLRTQDPDLAATVETACQKGGTGKTTLAASIAHEIARLGGRALLVDADPNAGLTLSHLALAIPPEQRTTTPTLTDLLLDPTPGSARRGIIDAPQEWQPDTSIPWTQGGALQPGGHLSVIPGSNDLPATIARIANEPAFERRLRRILTGVARAFDAVIIDCGPQNDTTAWITNHAAGAVLIAASPSDGAVVGANGELTMLHEHAKAWGDDLPLRVGGIVTIAYDQRKKTHRTQLNALIDVGNNAQNSGLPLFAPQTMTAPPGEGATTWTASAAVLPEIIKSASYYEEMHDTGNPVSWGLRPTSTAKWKYDVGYRSTYAKVLPWTRLALRTLQLVDAPVLATIEEALQANPIPDLWGPVDGLLTTADTATPEKTTTTKTPTTPEVTA